MSKYVDVAKAAKDLLSKSFVYSHKVEIKSTTTDGVTFTGEAVGSKPASASIKGEYNKGSVKVDKLQLSTDKKLVAELSMLEVAPGTKLSFKATDGSRVAGADAVAAAIGVEYRRPEAVVTVDVDPVHMGVDGSAVVDVYQGLVLGGQFGAKTSKSGDFAVSDYNVLAGYKTREYALSLGTEKRFQGAVLSYFQAVNATTSVAAVAKFPLAMVPSPATMDIEVGTSYKPHADTTVCGKLNAQGKVAVSYAQQVSPMTKLTFATEFDAANVTSDDHKMGIVLSITH